uniref:uncharacterized protein LOC118150158 n=1 Tax=Callithrix jacchus TaxID=9483 RepID=UPI00159E2743|nr:uncharacterized protein LOC118150158 [Callithrix jacchus]XP_035141090.1 uncharacterized protein LOC118150158 [Callithrix jacchus]XP_035141098.1 uncharacterized protein LOC118150158 [Callithrix jacchus]XP_035141100.1 uncharacterized protein LOC118150158 [Callithrix jacchus]XP_035141110.1 uncharacterized protein LOC118150158 [Callithrix jacchus]
MSQKNCEPEPGAPTSPSLLEEDDPGSLSWQQQATSSRDKKLLSSLHISHRAQVALECLPFFRTYGCLLAEERLVLQPEIPLQEDSELLGGFFPYYRSEEESVPSLAPPGWSHRVPYYHSEEESVPSLAPPGWSHRGSQDPPTARDRLAASAGQQSRTNVLDHGLYASGFVPYYRTPEEGLHTSLGPPASPSGSQGSLGAAQAWCSHTTGKLELTAAEATGEQTPGTC